MRKLSGYGPSLIVLATALLVLFLGPSAVKQLTYKQTEARISQASQRLESGNVLAQISQAYRDIAILVEPSVVHISAQPEIEDPRGFTALSLSTGSGWIYDDLGHVVTNYHVVKDAGRIEVQLSSGELREARMVGYDNSTDIAVLEIHSGRLHPAALGDLSEPIKQGDLVFAFGSPFDFRFSMSSGIVSGKGRYVGVIRDQVGRSGYENFIQVDAAINPGNSGGPLTDYRGRVIGMNTAIATGRGSMLEEGQFAGIGLAIPLEMIQPVVTQIIEKGVVEKGYLGVSVDLTGLIARRLDFQGEGVGIQTVEEDGPAARAGVFAGDIVTAINGKPVTTPTQLQSMISSMLPGEDADLTIWRRDEEDGSSRTLNITVTLTRLPTLRARGELPEDQSEERIIELGIAQMSTSTPELASRYGAPFHRGVLIERLVPGSRLESQILPGSTIVSVMDDPITDVRQFIDVLRRDYDLRRPVRVGVVRPDGELDVAFLRVEQ